MKPYNETIDAIVAIEACGFIFGPQVALALQVPLVPIRKHGKLPGKVSTIDYDLTYCKKDYTVLCIWSDSSLCSLDKDTMNMQFNILQLGSKVIIMDDLLGYWWYFIYFLLSIISSSLSSSKFL